MFNFRILPVLLAVVSAGTFLAVVHSDYKGSLNLQWKNDGIVVQMDKQ